MTCLKASKPNGNMVYCETAKATVNVKVICRRCQKNWPGDSPPDTVEQNPYLSSVFKCNNARGPSVMPSFADMIVDFGKAIFRWASFGFRVVSLEVFNARLEKCRNCPGKHWNDGRGVCRLCRCTKTKIHLATEGCPIGEWKREI